MRPQAARSGERAETGIGNARLAHLRVAIRKSRVTFPAQAPIFRSQYRADVQWRLAVLYFVHGWSCQKLSGRYGVSSGRVRQAIRHWADRAAQLGYLQRIAPNDDGAELPRA
jgi:hypothetical protein